MLFVEITKLIANLVFALFNIRNYFINTAKFPIFAMNSGQLNEYIH